MKWLGLLLLAIVWLPGAMAMGGGNATAGLIIWGVAVALIALGVALSD